MAIELGVLIAVITAGITIAGFFLNRQIAAKNEGATLTEMRKDIEYIVKEIKSIRETLDKRDEKHDESIRRLHARFDEHVKLYHSQGANN